MRKSIIISSVMLFAALFSCVKAGAASLKVGNVSIDRICMNKQILRLTDNGIILDSAPMGFEVKVNVSANGLAGKRIICNVLPLSADEKTFYDKKGELGSASAASVKSAVYNGVVTVVLPYQWLSSLDGSVVNPKIGVVLSCVDNENVSTLRVLPIDQSMMNIDTNNIGADMLGDIFGGSGGNMLDGLFGSMFSSGSVEATQVCPACDGTGLCDHCYGDAFFHPSKCRKCSSNPGICRRCGGTGTIKVNYDINIY